MNREPEDGVALLAASGEHLLVGELRDAVPCPEIAQRAGARARAARVDRKARPVQTPVVFPSTSRAP